MLLGARADPEKALAGGSTPVHIASLVRSGDVLMGGRYRFTIVGLLGLFLLLFVFFALFCLGFLGALSFCLDDVFIGGLDFGGKSKASSNGHFDVLQSLLRHRADCNKCPGHRTSPLSIAIQHDHHQATKGGGGFRWCALARFGMTPIKTCQNQQIQRRCRICLISNETQYVVFSQNPKDPQFHLIRTALGAFSRWHCCCLNLTAHRTWRI